MKTLKELFDNITTKHDIGISLEEMLNIVDSYEGMDWKYYINFGEKYTRNLIYSDKNIEMLLICWDSEQSSGVHDHPLGGCIMRVMSGHLDEYLYEPDLKLLKINHFKTDDISFIKGSTYLHNIVNNKEKTITLHIYSPPNYKANYYKLK